MSCDTKKNSLEHLKENEIISDTRIINNPEKFNEENRFLTAVASVKYKLDTGGQMLYAVESTTHKVLDRNFATSRTDTKVRAVPVDHLFEKLDVLIGEKSKEQIIKIHEIRNRDGVNRTLKLGFRHSGTDVQHYTEVESELINPNDATISNKGFLNQKTDSGLYNDLKNEYTLAGSYDYNINSASFTELDKQKKFYDFLKKKGLKGLEVYTSKGELQIIKFNQVESSEQSQEELLKLKSPTLTVSEDQVQKSSLETTESYSAEEASKILSVYSLEDVNKMLEEDHSKAIDTFGKLLYDNQLKTDIFVSNRDVNDQIKNCK